MRPVHCHSPLSPLPPPLPHSSLVIKTQHLKFNFPCAPRTTRPPPIPQK
jgi:hypothetical protein